MTTQTQVTVTITITQEVRDSDRPGPRKTMPPRIVEATATPIEEWADVIDLAPRQVA